MFKPKKDRIEYGGAIIGQEEMDAIFNVISSQGGRRWTIGLESEAFEKELAENTGVKRAVVVNSGSSALLLALTSLHLKRRSSVIIPALNFPTAFNAILQCGLIPHVVDIDLNTLNLDLEEVRLAVANNHNISAIIAVNIASNPVDLGKLRKIVGEKVSIILDNCDGYGTTISGKYVDSMADISCVSFHAAHIITMGEGGAILTDDNEIADRCRKLREWGRASGSDTIYRYPGFPKDYRERYVYEEVGYNMKPLELQCAMGRIQLKKLFSFKVKRIVNFRELYKRLSKYDKLQMVSWIPNADVCWFSFPFLCTGISRKKVMETLEKNNIECRTIFSGNVLRHPAYKDVEYLANNYTLPEMTMTNADIVMRDGVFISVHPSITKEMIEFIDKVIGKLCK
jgi:CDP-6-deoxy-D-xylo-4-hexulose-3-dehydrase